MKTGWESKTLNEVAKIYTGKWDANHAVPNGRFRFYTCAYEHLFCDTKRFSGENLILPGNGANVGEVFYYEGDFDAYQRTYVVGNIEINAKFLYYHMLAFWKKRNLNKQFGAATNFLKIGNFNEYQVSYPSLVEQKRIVKILDEKFEAIEKLKKVTEEQLNGVEELLNSRSLKITNEIYDSEVKREFSEVCDFVRGPFGGSLKKSIFKKTGYVVYEQQHAIYDQFSDIRYFVDQEKFEEMKRFEVKSGDLIMSCSGTIGKISIVPDGVKRGIINQALLKITPTHSILSSEYLKYWMYSRTFQEEIRKFSGGAAIQNVASVKVLKQILIPVPSLDKQKEIVSQLDNAKKESSGLASVYKNKLSDLEELKKSYLEQAFAGNL